MSLMLAPMITAHSTAAGTRTTMLTTVCVDAPLTAFRPARRLWGPRVVSWRGGVELSAVERTPYRSPPTAQGLAPERVRRHLRWPARNQAVVAEELVDCDPDGVASRWAVHPADVPRIAPAR
jgi:hypothetical protein